MKEIKPQRSLEDLTTTASFVLTIREVAWIRDEALRLGKNKSELVREIVDQAMAEQEKAAA